MRLDPSQTGDLLRSLSSGIVDARHGAQAERAADSVREESAFEPLDSLLLKRLRVLSVADAAGTVNDFHDAHALAVRTRELMATDASGAVAAHGELARDRLRDLLGDA